jgi:hypothetical protein
MHRISFVSHMSFGTHAKLEPPRLHLHLQNNRPANEMRRSVRPHNPLLLPRSAGLHSLTLRVRHHSALPRAQDPSSRPQSQPKGFRMRYVRMG